VGCAVTTEDSIPFVPQKVLSLNTVPLPNTLKAD
jgi:hypothetical protein